MNFCRFGVVRGASVSRVIVCPVSLRSSIITTLSIVATSMEEYRPNWFCEHFPY